MIRNSWNRWLSVFAFATLAGACTDQMPTSVEMDSTASSGLSPERGASYAVRKAAVARVTLIPGSFTLPLPGAKYIIPLVYDAQGNRLGLRGRSVEWSSSNPAVATVGPTGRVESQSGGIATISIKIDGVVSTAKITVDAPNPASIVSIMVTPGTSSLEIGSAAQLVAMPLDGQQRPVTGQEITWSSSNPAVATVSPFGEVTAVAAGNVTISAATAGKVGTAFVTVAAPAEAPAPSKSGIAKVLVVPGSFTLPVGGVKYLIPLVYDAQGNRLGLRGRSVEWSSSDPSVVTVNSTGQVIGLSQGTATISVTIDGVKGKSQLFVTKP